MPAFVRLLLIWLLALALPAQGIAAATMQFCGPGHAAQAPTGADHDHHAAAHQHADMREADAGGQIASAGGLAEHGKLKCSACAACCAGTALPPAALTLPVVEPAIERSITVPQAYAEPDAVGLERPPKRSRA